MKIPAGTAAKIQRRATAQTVRFEIEYKVPGYTGWPIHFGRYATRAEAKAAAAAEGMDVVTRWS